MNSSKIILQNLPTLTNNLIICDLVELQDQSTIIINNGKKMLSNPHDYNSWVSFWNYDDDKNDHIASISFLLYSGCSLLQQPIINIGNILLNLAKTNYVRSYELFTNTWGYDYVKFFFKDYYDGWEIKFALAFEQSSPIYNNYFAQTFAKTI